QLENIQMEKELCLASNRSLAEENLKQQPQLEEGRLLLAQKYQQLKTLHEAFTEKAARIESRADSQGVDTLLALLQAEGAKIEDETEKMAEHFMEGQLTLEEFVDDYQNKRRLAHMRRIKIEKLQEIIFALPARPAPLPPMPGRTSSPVHPQPGPQNSAPNSMHYPYFQGASMPAQALDPNRALPPLQHRGQGPSMPAPFSYQGQGYGAPQQPGGWPILHRAPNPPPRPELGYSGSEKPTPGPPPGFPMLAPGPPPGFPMLAPGPPPGFPMLAPGPPPGFPMLAPGPPPGFPMLAPGPPPGFPMLAPGPFPGLPMLAPGPLSCPPS
uniref:VPS37B subunit of ESCRT-I n=1 Tax=Petromyzon marinus TaxID=7757 RepID=S4REJ1_PETMA